MPHIIGEPLTALGRAVFAMGSAGLDATWEYPGYGVVVWPSKRVYVFGTANPLLGVDVYADLHSFQAGQPYDSIETNVPSNSTSVPDIFGAVMKAIMEEEEKHRWTPPKTTTE